MIEALRSFYEGKYCPIAVALMVFLGHATGVEALFVALLALLLIPALLICHDLRFGIMPCLSAIMIVSVGDYVPSDPGYDRFLKPVPLMTLILSVVAVFVCLFVFLIRNRRHANPLPRHSMCVSLLVFAVVFLCNGFFSKNYTPQNLLYAVGMAATLFLPYLLFALFLRFDRQTRDYFQYCMVIAGLLIMAELLFAYATTVQFDANGQIIKGSVVLGWGVWTNIGGMLALLMPSCFYFAASHRHGWIGFLLGLFEYVGIVLSQSRGALLIGTAVLLLCLLFLCLHGENRKRNRFLVLGLAICGTVGVVLVADRLIGLVGNFLVFGFTDNGRFSIWQIGWEHFLENPIFGSGLYDSYLTEEWDMAIFPYLYHNTVIQLLGSGGLVAVLGYLYHRVTTVRLALRKPNSYKSFLALGVLALLLFSLTDVLFFKLYPTVYYSLMLLFMERSSEST